ncbi:transporter substrate-binding domain-containing protein [Desulfobacterales bacterium HSG2]|nr:transporter substrate-binding domain-containing protein [Desulfobacterales bacterium HSG2]
MNEKLNIITNKGKERTVLLSVIIIIFLMIHATCGPLYAQVYAQVYAQDEGKYKSRNFVCASSNNFPPMNLLDKDGNLTGFGYDLSNAVIKAIGGKVTHIHSSHWTEVLEWVARGKADFIHDAGYTEERDKFLDYTDPIIEMPEAIFVRAEQYDITGFESLKGKTVACVNKHITHLYLQQFPEIRCHVVKTPVEGLYELVSGRADAFIYPKQIILYFIQKLRMGDKTKIIGEPLRRLTYSMVVRQGNKEALDLLNQGIAKVRKSGEYSRIYDKWWGRKILAGYSERELQVITLVTVLISVGIALLATLLIFNRRLSRRVAERTAELEAANRKIKKTLENMESVVEEKTSELIKANETLRMVLDNTHELIFSVDPNYRLITCNAAFNDSVRRSGRPEIAIGHTVLSEDYPEEFLNFWKECYDRALAGERFKMETSLLWTDGEHYFENDLNPIRGADGKITGVAVFTRDITLRKHAQDALRERTRELERSNRDLEQFAYVASHDLQEPLRTVASYVQLLARRYKGRLDTDADDFIEFAVDGAVRMKMLIDDLLAFSRVGAGERTFGIVDTEAVLTEAMTNLRASVRESGAVVTHDPLPAVVAESSQMILLFQDIIANGLKFCKEKPPRIHISAEKKEGEWIFSFQDNGIGIAPEYYDRIFVIFQRLHTRDKYPGTGIGLAICKKIVERHGGRIWVESREGAGSLFCFAIPIKEG